MSTRGDYELVVDQATGIVLRAACRLDGEEFAVTEIFDLSFDLPIDPELCRVSAASANREDPGAL